MKIVVVTGMSGAGKSTALDVFEDLGYYCIDNMPPELLGSFAELIRNSAPKTEKICFAVDIRSGRLFAKFKECVVALRESGVDVTVVFVDCDDSVLINRYKETRRRHPLELEASGNLMRAIELERREIESARTLADIYLDSSQTNSAKFREKLRSIFAENGGELLIDIVSFGYMYGIPKDADLVFDVRCFSNPYYIPELRLKTGLDDEVYSYVFSFEDSRETYRRIKELIEFLIPLYSKEKPRLVIAFGCTGGRHRSVSFARRLSEDFISEGRSVRVEHRCVER